MSLSQLVMEFGQLVRDRPNSSLLQVCDQVADQVSDLDSLMECGLYHVQIGEYSLLSSWHFLQIVQCCEATCMYLNLKLLTNIQFTSENGRQILHHRRHPSRRFWATVCEMIYPVLSDHCLSCPVCLSVCNIGVLWPDGWMDQDATWCGDRPRPR